MIEQREDSHPARRLQSIHLKTCVDAPFLSRGPRAQTLVTTTRTVTLSFLEVEAS